MSKDASWYREAGLSPKRSIRWLYVWRFGSTTWVRSSYPIVFSPSGWALLRPHVNGAEPVELGGDRGPGGEENGSGEAAGEHQRARRKRLSPGGQAGCQPHPRCPLIA